MSELDTTETGVMHPFIVLAKSNGADKWLMFPLTTTDPDTKKIMRIWFNGTNGGSRELITEPIELWMYRYSYKDKIKKTVDGKEVEVEILRRNVFAVQKLVEVKSLSAWVYIVHIELPNPRMVLNILPSLKKNGVILDWWRNIMLVNNEDTPNATAVKDAWPSSPGWRVDRSLTDVPDYSGPPRIGMTFAPELAKTSADYELARKGAVDDE